MIKRYAVVIDNIDPDELGAIQVRPLPEGAGWEEDSLPWARPLDVGIPGIAEGVGEHNVPAIGEMVAVIASSDWQTYDYQKEGPQIADWYPYTKFTEDFDQPDLEAQEYPEPSFKRTPEGTIVFHNRTTGEMGIQHPSGLYVAVSTDGNLYVKYVNEVRIANEDESVKIHLDGENSKIDVVAGETVITSETSVTIETGDAVLKCDSFTIGDGGDDAVLFTPLEEVLNELIKAMVIAPSGPSSSLVDSSMAPLSAKLAPKIPKMKSKKVTLD